MTGSAVMTTLVARDADFLQKRCRPLVAHDDTVRTLERRRRGAAVAGPVNGADALGIDEDLFMEEFRAADDGEVIV